jgi:hypothetical protein
MPEVAIAMNCPVCPGAATDKVDGRIAIEAIGSGVPPDLPVTVKAAEPVTTDLSGLVNSAVMAVEPWPVPVTSPPTATVPILTLLELQVTWLVISA